MTYTHFAKIIAPEQIFQNYVLSESGKTIKIIIYRGFLPLFCNPPRQIDKIMICGK